MKLKGVKIQRGGKVAIGPAAAGARPAVFPRRWAQRAPRPT